MIVVYDIHGTVITKDEAGTFSTIEQKEVAEEFIHYFKKVYAIKLTGIHLRRAEKMTGKLCFSEVGYFFGEDAQFLLANW